MQVVAPYVGAWIETQIVKSCIMSERSHPTWVRGLKLRYTRIFAERILSHPTWVRGLKHTIRPIFLMYLCRTLRGCVD